jgi:hypothetical protein
MQVKSLVHRKKRVAIDPELAMWDLQRKGSALLNTWRRSILGSSIDDDLRRNGVQTDQHIPLDWVIFNDSFDHHGSSVDVLYLLGGRASIVHWLRLQGENPLIFNAVGSEALYANIFRKQKRFEKSMTLVAIHPIEQVPVSGGSWTGGRPVDLIRSPLSPRRDKAEFTPSQLGRVLEWIFVNTPG